MPIPKPKQNEKEDAYISRCMAAIGGEYDDNEQAVAICYGAWRDKDKKKMESEPKLFDVTEEIFAEGIWNGMGFAIDDLKKIVETFDELKDVHQVPLKMGHNKDQPMTDGQPALGWVDALWIEGKKLMGKFVDVPEIVYNAMQQKKYRNKSIELDLDVSYKGNKYEYVLSGVALLGADIPAVNTLNDLSYYLASRRASYAAANHVTFSVNNQNGDFNMNEVDDLKAKIASLEQTIGTLKGENEKLKATNAEFSRQVADFEKKETERAEADKKAAFERDVKAFEADVEKLVEEKKITPAARDVIMADLGDSTKLEQAKFSLKAFEANAKVIDEKGQGMSGSTGSEDGTPDEILANRIQEYQRANKVDFHTAKRAVLQEDPDLARAYVTMT